MSSVPVDVPKTLHSEGGSRADEADPKADRERSKSSRAEDDESPGVESGRRAETFRPWLLGLTAVRLVLAVVAIPLVPVLYDGHFPLVALLRPTKDVLLGGGFLARRGDAAFVVLVFAALPLAVGGVWLMYALGLAYKRDLKDADLPGLAGRLLKRDRIRKLEAVLDERGWPLVFFGRLASFPSSVLAAAAGTSGMNRKHFLLADGAGALVSILLTLGAGWVLGEAYRSAGPWLAALGLLMLAALAGGFGWRLQRSTPSRSSRRAPATRRRLDAVR